jgi:cell division protein FtsB
MYSLSRTLVKGVIWVGVAMVVIVVFHIGGILALRVGQFSPLTGAFIGGTLVLSSVLLPMRKSENVEPWIGSEQVGWVLIGLGTILWGMGETFWRYYMSIGQAPFPSVADIGYSTLPVLIFIGLLLLPSSESGGNRFLLLMDSLISMGSILAIAWYLLLGSLAQMPGEANLGKFLGLYYPIADTALLSCVVFILLRNHGSKYRATARRTSLLVIGLGLCFFVTSDYIFNIQQNAGTYVEATWIDLGWPLGLMTLGVAAYLRRFLPATPAEVIQQRMEDDSEYQAFGATRFIPYILLALLFFVLTLNVLSTEPGQYAIRPVLLAATMGVVALVVIRQIFTLWENARLAKQQAESLSDLERANKRIEEQNRQIAEHNAELEQGIMHLKDVQALLANGNLRARANLTSGALMPLAGSLNLMAERLMRLGQTNVYVHRLLEALGELSMAFERHAKGAPFIIPRSCNEFLEINRLLISMRLEGISTASPTPGLTSHARDNEAQRQTPIPRPVTTPLAHGTRDLQPDSHSSLKRQTNTLPPQSLSSIARLRTRSVSESQQLPSSGPLQLPSSGPLQYEKISDEGA